MAFLRQLLTDLNTASTLLGVVVLLAEEPQLCERHVAAHASGGGAVGGGAAGARSTRCSSRGSSARSKTTPRSVDALARSVRSCLKKSI